MRVLLSMLVLTACATGPSPTPAPAAMPDADIHSYARPAEVRSTHLDLDLTLDFDAHKATGSVTHRLERRDPNAPFVLDSTGLLLTSVTDQDGAELACTRAEPDPVLGTKLSIRLLPSTQQVRIAYETSPDAEAMQWLAPQQTNGGTKPFLFTQGEAILTRSWIPLQDSPAVRVTWTARIHAPPGLVVLMSADQRGRDGDTYTFAMNEPVPSYLIALACGDLTSRDISPRCAVWTEPSTIELAASEFSDMESMVAACEQLFGPYRWGRYDVLVLPPSFPFGGMENPCLTFATPTVLAGDKSLVSLVAHELAHSWSGNLVTNATWRDFWLNEGFTVYLERRVMERVYGAPRATMEAALGMQELGNELATLPKQDQVLHIDLAGRNPDDGMTQVPYEKGAAFLRRLEQAFGRARLDAFLRAWFDGHAFQSVTTGTFLAFLDEKLLRPSPELARQVDVEAWVRGPGLPAEAQIPDSALFAAVDAQKARWLAGGPAAELDAKTWVTQQWQRFLDGLGPVPEARLAELDHTFALTRSGNSEILCAWLIVAIKNGYRAVDARLDQFLMTVGRRKFLKPIYEALLAAPDGKARATAIYAKARPRYHAVSQRTLDAMLGYQVK
ncbi:MAG TPA: M1 family metallopeptidase [Planctomycetota bacterium]|nr:M1 family metallopeptidase [Planctomycetota bacterium]